MSEKKKGLFARLREGLSKTRGNLTEKVDDMVRENRKIDEDFYEETAKLLRSNLQRQHAEIEQMGILKPFSFVLEDDERESLEELHLIDDETIIIGGNLMEDLEKDLDCFLEGLLK